MIINAKMRRGYNIALHGIRSSEGSYEKAQEIMEKGLYLPSGSTSVCSTTIQFGDTYRNKNFNEELRTAIKNYEFGANTEGYVMIIKSPTVISNSKGEVLFLGDPYTGNLCEDKATHDTSRKYIKSSFLDCACSKRIGEEKARIPPEFILGFIDPKSKRIIKNHNHYSMFTNNKSEKKDILFEWIKSRLNGMEIEISEKIAQNKFNELAKDKELLKVYKMQEYIDIIAKAEMEYGLSEISNAEQDYEE